MMPHKKTMREERFRENRMGIAFLLSHVLAKSGGITTSVSQSFSSGKSLKVASEFGAPTYQLCLLAPKHRAAYES